MHIKAIDILGIAAGQGAGKRGTEDGPRRLRELGLAARLAALGGAVADLGDVQGALQTEPTTPGLNINSLPHIVRVNRHLRDAVLGTRQRRPEALLLLVGGDHSLAIGTLAGLSDSCERLGIIWIDAHADFNTPASSPSGNAHGMSLAIACGHGYVELRNLANRDPLVAESDVYVLGTRDIDPEERLHLDRSAVHELPMSAWRAAGLAAATEAALADLATRCDHIHLSFDIDVLAPELVPGTGTPVAGGLTADEARGVFRALAASDQIASAEFVEYNPHLDVADRTGVLTLELLTTWLAAGDEL